MRIVALSSPSINEIVELGHHRLLNEDFWHGHDLLGYQRWSFIQTLAHKLEFPRVPGLLHAAVKHCCKFHCAKQNVSDLNLTAICFHFDSLVTHVLTWLHFSSPYYLTLYQLPTLHPLQSFVCLQINEKP